MLRKKEMTGKSEAQGLQPWRPFRELHDLKSMVQSAIEDFFSDGGRELTMDLLGGRTWMPAVDVEENDKEYIFEIELPGLAKDEFKVEVQNNTLIISGERKEKKEDKSLHYLRHEQFYGAFRRAFTLPDDVNAEAIKAAHKNGILTVTLPRSEQGKPKAIQVCED